MYRNGICFYWYTCGRWWTNYTSCHDACRYPYSNKYCHKQIFDRHFVFIQYFLSTLSEGATSPIYHQIYSSCYCWGICGSLLAVSLSEQTMNYMACVLLLLALVVTLKNKAWTEVPDSLEHQAPHFWQPFFIAMYDGGFGPGSSTFSILHYLRTHHTYIKAVQLTRVLLFGSCTGAFIVFYHTGFIQWHYAIAMAVGSIIGSQLGLIVLPYIPLKIAKTLLTLIIILLLVQVTLKII